MLSLEDFESIRQVIYREAGLFFADNKIDFLSRRVAMRMAALGLESARDYSRYLRFNQDGTEQEALIELVITYESYFFRDYPQLKMFAEEVLPMLADSQKASTKQLNLLSAGCSTGEEAYTLSIILREMLDNLDQWHIRVDGVDINRRLLARAKAAIYNSRSLRETPNLYKDRYFERTGNDFALSETVRRMVRFSRVNIFNKAQMDALPLYDVVFCRNVLIYFDHESAAKVMGLLYEHMKPGAFIFLGAAESVGRLSSLFEMIRIGNSFLYRK